jgi:ABC-type multidrug transport system fused ATPase/permease subunit
VSPKVPPPPPSASPFAQRARLAALLGDRRKTMAGLAGSSIVSGLAESFMIVMLAQIATTIVNKSKHVPVKIAGVSIHASVDRLFVYAFGLALVRLALQAGPLAILPARIGADVQAKLRQMLFHSFTRASWEVQSQDKEGHLQEIMTSQVLQASQGAQQSSTLITASFTFMVLMITAVSVNARAAGIILAASLVLFAAMRPLNRLGVRRARQLSRAQLDYAGGISETVRLAEETQVFGVGGAQRNRIDEFIRIARNLYLRAQMIMRLTPNLYQSMMYLLIIGGLWALYEINRHDVAALSAVILLLIRAGTQGQNIQGAYQGLRQSLPFIERLQNAAARYNDSTPTDGTEHLERVDEIAFEHVSFHYRPGHPVLNDVTFEVEGGEAIGIIGPSGAGKSTLVQILLQLRQPVEGSYLVNGLPANGFTRADWHRRVAYVPQEPKLLHATVADNIRYLREGLDDDAVERAAKHARIHDDIVGWRDGYETIVGPRADAVSGGQQQRICLARALVAAPEVLVLDEPTSALDPHSEVLIQESLRALRRELTLFIIAHRMSTLDVCDRVMVISEGRLAAFDMIDVLQRENPYYRMATTIAAGGALP